MTTANIKTAIPCEVHKVMEAILAVDRYPVWRSNVSKINVIDENQYIEYTKDGYATRLSLTVVEADSRLEFDLENDQVKGHWTCLLMQKGKESEISILSTISAKGLSTRPIGQSIFEQSCLKKEQKQFVSDLKNYLG